MSAPTNNFKIGLFVIIGIALLIAALFSFGARSYFQKEDIFETYVPGEVQGLSVGSAVKLRGVTIGKVTFIGFVWNEYPKYGTDFVLIRFEVPKKSNLLPPFTTNFQTLLNEQIAQGMRARVQGQGITGTSILCVDFLDPERNPPMQVPWTPKHYYIPSAPGQFTQILASVEKTMRKLEQLDLSNTVARLDRLLDSANHLVNHVDQVDFNTLGKNANHLVAEVRDTNFRLQATLADAQDAIKGADLRAISRKTQALEARLDDLAIELQGVVGGLDTGSLNATLENTREATEGLKDLIGELKDRPSMVIFSKPPLPAESVETPARK